MGGSDPGIAGMLGRPDLSSGYGYYMSGPVVGGGANSVNGSTISSGVSGSISGNVGTAQMSMSLVAAMVVLLGFLYFASRAHQH